MTVEASDASAVRRVAILEAAIEIFSRYGFKKTSMDDLARAAGLSRQGLYLHFATKEALFQAALLHFVEKLRATGREALAREDVGVEERLVGVFAAVHGAFVGGAGLGHLNELLEVAAELVPTVVEEFEDGLVADVARVLRASGVAAAWKDAGLSAKDLAENLCAASEGFKHRAETLAEYRDRTRVAVRIVCSRLGGDAAR